MFRIQNTNHCRQLILKDKAPIRESASIFENIFVTPRGLPQIVFSNRCSRPYNVAVRSFYLTAGSYTMYRQAHSCRQVASSRNVKFCPFRFPRKNRHT